MPARFDDAIPFFNDTVLAIGPQHPLERIKEVFALVYQPMPDGLTDAAATVISTQESQEQQPSRFAQLEGKRWVLPLKKISTAVFMPGRAYAVAFALMVERSNPEKEQIVYWRQPVELQENEEMVLAAADAAKALMRGGPLSTPLEFRGDR